MYAFARHTATDGTNVCWSGYTSSFSASNQFSFVTSLRFTTGWETVTNTLFNQPHRTQAVPINRSVRPNRPKLVALDGCSVSRLQRVVQHSNRCSPGPVSCDYSQRGSSPPKIERIMLDPIVIPTLYFVSVVQLVLQALVFVYAYKVTRITGSFQAWTLIIAAL